MQPIDLTENNSPITSEQVEKPVGCGGTCGGKCGSKKEGKGCCAKKCCCLVKVALRIVAAVLLFYAGYLYGKQ
jgi:hypothetical protein